MPYSMKFYQDQLVVDGEQHGRGELASASGQHRLLFVRHGVVKVNGKSLSAGESAYFHGDLQMLAESQWSQVWRWEIDQPNAAQVLLQGNGVLSVQRLARVITTMELVEGGAWLFRLDSVNSIAGRVTPRHGHRGPGIRCLYQGTFNVQDASHVVSDQLPGDAWWESGEDTVVAWHSTQMPAIFIRALILPLECRDTMSNIWKSDGAPPKANWRLFIDQGIVL